MDDIEDIKTHRLAIVDSDKCKPNKCKHECMKKCPVNMSGKRCIEIEDVKAQIHEILCTGCGQCVKRCPFGAIKIVKLPSRIPKLIHKFGKNGFQIHSLPQIQKNKVLGLVGVNGIGKSTILKVFKGHIIPNLGNKEVTYDELARHFRGSQLQNVFKQFEINNFSAVMKPQSINNIANKIKGTISDHLSLTMASDINLQHIMDRPIANLSGGELQRFLIAATLKQDKDLYMLDEPSCFLDIKERLNLARIISNSDKTLIFIEHDIALLDYVSDMISIVYGSPGAYGIVSNTYTPRNCLNYFIDGYLPSENMRIRPTKLSMRPGRDTHELNHNQHNTLLTYDSHEIQRGSFKLQIPSGCLHNSSILLILGENGTGKTTFVEDIVNTQKTNIKISYKPQTFPKISNTTVIDYLMNSLENRLYEQFL